MNWVDGIPIWGDPIDAGALLQIKNCAKTAEAVASMAGRKLFQPSSVYAHAPRSGTICLHRKHWRLYAAKNLQNGQ